MHDLSKLNYIETLVLGYQIVYMPNHPHANKSGGWVYLHRIVMENKIKRYLDSNEIVHHLDEDRSNNLIENLELLSIADHSRLHSGIKEPRTCQQCGIEFIYKWSTNLNIFCSKKCSSKSQSRIIWPSIEELGLQLKTKSMLQLSKELGISDNAIRKHIRNHKNVPVA